MTHPDIVQRPEATMADPVEIALALLEALQEQVAECFCEYCEMCARHEEIIRRAEAQLKGEV